MASENERDGNEADERDEDERDEDAEEGGSEGVAAGAAGEDAAVGTDSPKNRAERRAAAKAARRGRKPEGSEPGEMIEVRSDGSTNVVEADGTRRPRVPPRTMARGTGDAEGVPLWVRNLGDYVVAHKNTVLAGVVGVIVVVGGVIGVQQWMVMKEAKAADAYAAALEVFRAPVSAEDTPEPENAPPRRGPRFHTHEERARAAVERFRRVEQQFPNSRVAPLARLDEASTLYQLGRYDEAKQIYRGLLASDVAGLEGRVIEGYGFTLESTNDLDGAMAQFRSLQTAQGGAFRDAAQYYQARLLNRRGDNTRAKEMLHTLIERLAHGSVTDPTVTASGELRNQAVALLRDVDPTDPVVTREDQEGTAPSNVPGGRGIPGLSPDLLRQLMRQQATKQGG